MRLNDRQRLLSKHQNRIESRVRMSQKNGHVSKLPPMTKNSRRHHVCITHLPSTASVPVPPSSCHHVIICRHYIHSRIHSICTHLLCSLSCSTIGRKQQPLASMHEMPLDTILWQKLSKDTFSTPQAWLQTHFSIAT